MVAYSNALNLINQMKIHVILFIVLAFTCFLLVTCSKVVPPPIIKPQLWITLKNDTGKAVSGASVRLYKRAGDSGITKLSDSAGLVIFSELEDSLYYWLAEKGCSTNRVSQTTLNRPMVPNGILYGYSVMTPTGALKIINNSTEPYKVSDSTASFTVKKDSPYFAYRRVKSFLIHSEKLATPGAGKDTLIKIKCGDTTVVQLP
jgi:hypothetical protein